MRNLQNLSPTEYLRIFWRRRWFFIATFLLLAIGASVYILNLTDIYRSEARVRIQTALIAQDYVRPSYVSTPENQIASIRAQMQGRTFLEGIVQELGMFGYPASGFSMDTAVAVMRGSLSVANASGDTFIISFGASDPQIAQSVARRLVEKLKQNYEAARKKIAVETDQFLDDQLRDTESKLKAEEEKIKQFKTAHLGELPEQSTANMNALSGLQAQLVAVENAIASYLDQRKLLDSRMEEQKRLGTMTSTFELPSLSSGELETAPKNSSPLNTLLASKEAELATLKIKYMPAHPDVQRVSREIEQLKSQIAAAEKEINASALTPLGQASAQPPSQVDTSDLDLDNMQDIVTMQWRQEAEMIKNELSKREKERTDILGQIKRYQARLNLAPAIEQEFMALSRNHETLRQQYVNLQNKKFQAQMTSNLENDQNVQTFSVLDEANLPEKPEFPNRVQIAFMGLGAAFLAGIGAAFGREMLDSTLGSEHEVVSALNIPVLASISEIPRKEPKRLPSVKTKYLGKTA